jgi:hypothetical protein
VTGRPSADLRIGLRLSRSLGTEVGGLTKATKPRAVLTARKDLEIAREVRRVFR